VAVDVSQAGLPVQCACGATMVAPSYRGMQALAPAQTDTGAARGAAWGMRQQLVSLGAVLAMAGIAAGFASWRRMPEIPPAHPADLKFVRDEVAGMNVSQAFAMWDAVTFQGIDHLLNESPIDVESEQRQGKVLFGVSMLIAAAGVGLAALGALSKERVVQPPPAGRI
jgi:hypothetical protein